MDPETRKQFERLVCRMEPENLSCDGELSRSATQRRYNELKREWRELEKIIGRQVTQEEIVRELFARR